MHCWPLSVVPGSRVTLHDNPGEVEVVRDGLHPEVVWRGAGDSIDVGADWATGMYVVRHGDDPPTAWFVVRATGRIVLALATNTWNAYNATGGDNLYTGAVELRFDRPLAPGMLAKPDDAPRLVDGRDYARFTREHALDTWHGMAGWAGQERRFVRWAEEHGIDLAYATNADLEDPSTLDGCSLLLSVGHDEYWSWAMRDTVEAFVGGGGNVAFFSGNTCYWQVRIEDGGRNMVCFKHRYAEDPVQSERTTTMWSDPITGRPETDLTGVSFTRGGYHRIWQAVPNGAGAYEVHRPDHWLLAGTGLRRGDLFGVIGYECDGCDLRLDDGIPRALHLEVVATAPATPFDEHTTPLPLAPGGRYELEFHAERLHRDPESLRNGHAVLGSYVREGTVVTVGCTDWAYGLGDPIVDRVTTNIIERLS